jgi:hypothetical protein
LFTASFSCKQGFGCFVFQSLKKVSMRIEELYQDVIITVCDVTGIDEADILHSNREECADA